MNFGWVKPLLRKGWGEMVKHSPGILMGLGTSGTVTAVIFAAQATPRAQDRVIDRKLVLAAEEYDLDVEQIAEDWTHGRIALPKLSFLEWLKAAGPAYAPAAGMTLFSLLCFWSAHGIDMKRQAVLAGLYSTAEQALAEYQSKVKELIGEKAEREVRNEVQRDKVEALPPPQNTVILAEDSELWCLIDEQYFRGTWVKIKDAQNDANHEMIQHMYISQQELYWLLDPDKKYLKPKPDSGSIGWSVDRMLELDIHVITNPEHKPVLCIEYRDKDGNYYPPKPGYSASYL